MNLRTEIASLGDEMIDFRPSQTSTATASAERRLFQRLPIAIQVEIRAADNPVPIRLKTSDISIGGCYVEMAVTLDPGTVVGIVLWLEHEKHTLDGRVVTRHPHFGNGIEFLAVTREFEERLRTFLAKAENSRII